MPELSTADHSSTPPHVNVPERYNAAYDLLQRNLQAGRGDKPAFIDDKGSYTYAWLDEATARFAGMLLARGVRREERVLLCLHDSIDFPVAFLGAIRAGIIPVPVNTLLKGEDYKYMFDYSRSTLAIVSAPLAATFAPFVPADRLLVSGGDGANSLAAATDAASPVTEYADTLADEACFWLFSSGSTGMPKGTVHIHASMIRTAEYYARPILDISESDVVFSAAKLFFAYGLGNGLSFPMSVGATAVLMAERPTPAAVAKRLTEHQPNIFYGVPTLYAGMLASDALPARDQVSLRLCTSAGEALPPEISRRWREHFAVEILDGIGSTEMLHIFLSNRSNDVRDGTTGLPVPGYEVRLVDDEGRVIEGNGESGELHIKGLTSAAFYWNNRAKSRHTFIGDWTRSGDKYSRDEDGYYVYAGRSDDMLKVSGIYVSPIEVENVLMQHESVLEAAVVGKEDDDGLIKPAAFVVLKANFSPDESLAIDLKAYVKSQLAPYKYPRWFSFVEDLPKTATGKIQRFRLRTATAEEDALLTVATRS